MVTIMMHSQHGDRYEKYTEQGGAGALRLRTEANRPWMVVMRAAVICLNALHSVISNAALTNAGSTNTCNCATFHRLRPVVYSVVIASGEVATNTRCNDTNAGKISSVAGK